MRSAIYICSGAFGARRERAGAGTARSPSASATRRTCAGRCSTRPRRRVGRDETDAAARALDAALAIPTAPNDGSSTIEKHYATAVVRAAQGRWRGGDRVGRRDHRHARAPAAVGLPLRRLLRRRRGRLLRCARGRRCDRAATLRRAQRGCKVVRRAARQFGSVRARRWLLEGLLEWARGRPRRGARALAPRRGGRAARRGRRFELARARFEIARHSDGAGRRARRLPGRRGGDVRAPGRAADAAARARGAGRRTRPRRRTDDRDLPARAARR